MITIACIGKMGKDAPEQALIDHYLKQMKNVKVLETDIKPAETKKEGAWLLRATEGMFRVMLDADGKEYDSERFAAQLQKWQTAHANIAFLIGGAEGHSEEVRSSADDVLSLSKMTFPHKIARTMLVEQIYRAEAIKNNHPYHK